MPKRALLKFRNPDSTKDINDRFSGLFNKGVFLGGQVTPVPGVLRVDVAPFATVGSDGMFVREDSEITRLDVSAGTKNYIVIRQEYIANGDPVVSVESLTEIEFNGDGAPGLQGVNNPSLIVFATVNVPMGANSVDSSHISTVERNSIDTLGRLEFRGAVDDEVDLPGSGLNVNRENDFYIVRNGPNNEPALYAWDGADWFNMTNTGEVLTLLNNHQANILEDQKHLTDIQADSMASTTGDGSEAVTTSEIPFSLPLAEVLISYDSQISEFDIGEVVSGGTSNAEGTVAFDSTSAIGDGVIALKNVTGTFLDGEQILSGIDIRATVNGDQIQNRVVSQQDPRIPTQDENDALLGNFVNSDSLEPETPSDTNRFISSSKIFAAPTEISFPTAPANIELDDTAGPYFVGNGAQGTAQRWFNLYSSDVSEDSEYINSEFGQVIITRVLTGPKGGPPSANELNPSTDGNVDALGFYNSSPSTSLFLETDEPVDTAFRVSYGKRTRLGDLLPELLMSRGPDGGQIDTKLARLLLGTPNAMFGESIFDASISPGEVVAWNGSQFVLADPNIGLTPIGVRGNYNNLIQEGLFVSTNPGAFSPGPLYADKTNLGQLTTTPNEWFIGVAISQTSLLVNMNSIPLQASGAVVTPVAFPSSMFDPTLQPGRTVSYNSANMRFEFADPDDPSRIPLGIRGNNNNVIQSGVYVSSSGNPFTPGTRYYFGRSSEATAGVFTTVENDWPLGVAIATNQLLVNSTNFPIPSKWDSEHDPDSGFHTFASGNQAARDGISGPQEGQIFIRTDTNPPRIDYYNGAAWEEATSDRIDVPSGTKMMFVQNFVPTGWTLDATLNDRAVMITNVEASGGNTGGQWIITGLTGDPHALTINQMPEHNHPIIGGGGGEFNFPYNTSNVGPTTGLVPSDLGRPTENEGGGESHSHGVTSDGTWRPSFVNVIVCIKN